MTNLHPQSQFRRLAASPLTRRHALALAAGAALATGRGDRRALALGTGTPQQEKGPAPLIDLLACIPDWFLDLAGETYPHWFYDDLKQQLDAFGIAPDAADPIPDGFINVTRPMLTDSVAFDYAQITDFTDAIGFQPSAVHQTLAMGDNDRRFTLFRGGIDLDALPALWETAGYRLANSGSGHEIWTLGGPGDFDFAHPIQGAVFADFNNVAILAGDILAYAADFTILDRAAETQAAEIGSVADDPATAPLCALLPSTTIACYAIPGGLFSSGTWPPDLQAAWAEPLADSDAAVGPMPACSTMIFGATVGLRLDDPDAAVETYPVVPDTEGTVVLRILATSSADAAQIGRVIEHRWNTGESGNARVPFTDLMTIADVSIEGSVAMIDFAPVTSPGVWNTMVVAKDVFPFLHEEERT
jgi:hypothetical protein